MPYIKFAFRVVFVLLLLSVVGCQSPAAPSTPTSTPEQQVTVSASATPESSGGYPAPQAQVDSRGYPAPTAIWTKQTAFQSYPPAQEAALKWNPNAQLYEIPATVLMELNFGRPLTGEGWYFMFKVADSPLEYYVYVSDGQVSGTTEAQPIIFDKPPYEFEPLPPLSSMWDSDRVLNLYDQNGGKAYLSENPKAILNCQLSYLKGDASPIWRIYDASKAKETKVLFAVNALTGEILPPE